MLRDLLPHSTGAEATATYDSANDELVVDYRLGPHVPEPAVIPDIYVFGPDGFQRREASAAAGSFRVRLTIGRRQGLFRGGRWSNRARSRNRPVPVEDEMTDYGSTISSAPDFRRDGRTIQSGSGGCVRRRREVFIGDAALADFWRWRSL